MTRKVKKNQLLQVPRLSLRPPHTATEATSPLLDVRLIRPENLPPPPLGSGLVSLSPPEPSLLLSLSQERFLHSNTRLEHQLSSEPG